MMNSFANDSVFKTDFDNNINPKYNTLVNVYQFKQLERLKSNCRVQVLVTVTNTETGESSSYTYWVDLGWAASYSDCQTKAAIYIAGL